MASAVVNSDADLLDLLRVAGPLDVSEMAGAIEVTATAVRQRLSRMMARGLIARQAIRAGRGRPRHRYQLTDRGIELTGSNFTDLAMALWQELASIKDPALRQDMLRRVAKALARSYASQVKGLTPEERLRSVSDLLARKRVPFEVEGAGDLTVLTARACPYPRLADNDRAICSMEAMVISELVGTDVELKTCRLDGDGSCRFQAK
jgi:DeoR family transcriptional regulator, suf operon transcriptional repressor